MSLEKHIGDQRPLRCQECGQQIGLLWGDDPDPALCSVLCYACAVTTEAESITASAGDDAAGGVR